jgi:hypothetical protein
MENASGPRRRRIGRIVAAVVGGLAVLVTVLPLVVRGPVARWAVRQASGSLCGTFQISGGHLGWASVWQLLVGRPMELVIEGIKIDGPDDKSVFAAARLEATVEVHLRPFRLVLSRVLMARGGWRLSLLPNQIGSFDAFRAIPEEGRAACLNPRAKAKPKKPGAAAGSVVLRSVQFEDVDVDLEFPTWELELGRANAVGSLSVGGSGPPLLFEARDVIAPAGALRIGRRGEAWTARVPFDAVSIARVAVTPEAATDLVLEVASADTGRARLSGRAAFLNIFPLKAAELPPGVPGLDADVRWAGFGSALRQMDASFRPQGAWGTHLDGDLIASVKGPFTALEGTLKIEGGPTHLEARVAHGAADLSIAFAGQETGWMLDPALRPLLGGLLHGHFHATARLWPTLAGIEAEIPDADLRLDRRRAPSGPRRFQLRIGKSGGPPDGATDTLYASVASVRLADAELRLDGLRADWTGLSARVDARVAFATSARRPDVGKARRERSVVSARGTLAVAALEDWIPGGAVSGPLRLGATAEGTIERIALGLSFPPPGTVGVLGQRFALPRRLDALLTADAGLSVPRFQLRRLGGGTIQVGGRVGAAGKLAATVGVHDYPVAAIPGLPRDKLPGPLTGTLAAELTLGGTLARPNAEGKIDVRALAMGRRPVGDVETSLRVGTERGEVDATVDPGITVQARVRRRPNPSLEATVTIRDRALGPWLPAPFAGAPLALSGDVKVGYRAADGLSGDGTLTLSGPGLTGVALTAEAHGVDARARLKGEVDIARWPQLWSRVFKSAQGALAFDLTLAPDLADLRAVSVRPHVSGNLQIARALAFRTPRWPAPIGIEPGGQITLDGNAVTVSGLTLVTPGLRAGLGGRALVDLEDLEQTRLALTMGAELDAAAFPVRLPAGVVARGKAAIDAQVSGTLGATPGPRVDGKARLDGLTVQLAPSTPAARASGVVEAHGDTLRTDTLRVDLAGVGAVTIGRPGAPASAVLASLSPFRLGAVDVPFEGQDLRIGDPSSKLYLPDLDANLRLSGDGRSELRIDGQVAVAGGSYDSSRGGKKQPAAAGKPRASGAWYRALPPHLTLDLDLRGTNKGMRVAVPVLPDVTVDFQCHLLATNRGAKWSGHLRGDGAYARAAVAVADWFSDNDLRKCQLTK